MAKGGGILQPVLLFGALGVGAWFLMRQSKAHGIKKMARATANIKLRIDSFVRDHDGITMQVSMLNPNTENIDIRSVVGSMYINSIKVGDVSMFGDYNVQGNSQMKIPLNIRPLPAFRAVPVVKGVSKVVFLGTINANNAAIPLNLSYTA